MKYLFCLCILLGCGQSQHNQNSDMATAQYQLDNKNYHGAISTLQSMEQTTETKKLLIDAYIGAAGFELIPFLISLSDIPAVQVEGEEHLVQYLKRVFDFYKYSIDFDLHYFQLALDVLSTLEIQDIDYKESKFKTGVLYLYRVIHTLKLIGTQFTPTVIIDENGKRVIFLSDEENKKLITLLENCIEYSWNAYLSLRSSFNEIQKHFIHIDTLIASIWKISTSEIDLFFKGKNFKDLIKYIFDKNPKILSTLLGWISEECEHKKILNDLYKFKQVLTNHPNSTYYLNLVQVLIDTIQTQAPRVCVDQL